MAPGFEKTEALPVATEANAPPMAVDLTPLKFDWKPPAIRKTGAKVKTRSTKTARIVWNNFIPTNLGRQSV